MSTSTTATDLEPYDPSQPLTADRPLRSPGAEEISKRPYIERLNHDVLSDIFERLSQTSSFSADTDGRPPPEMILSQVSSHWRSIVVQLSALWSHIHVCSARPTGSVEAYLERSQLRLLRVTVDLRDMDEARASGTVLSLWPRIVEYAFRWRDLYIMVRGIQEISQILGFLDNCDTPILGMIYYRVDEEIDLESFNNLPTSQGILRAGAPELRTICLVGFPLRLQSHWPPLSDLTTLFICNIFEEWDENTFRAFIAGASSLENLSIHRDPILKSNDLPPTPIVISTLRVLRLEFDILRQPSESIWWYLACPDLEVLHLVNAQPKDYFEFRNKLPKLESLVIDDCMMDVILLQLLSCATRL